MLERIEKLEEFAKDAQKRLARIEAQLEGIVRQFATMADLYATKEDLQAVRAEFHKELHAMTWKIIGACAALVAVTFWVARNVGPPTASDQPAAAAVVQPAPAVAPVRPK